MVIFFNTFKKTVANNKILNLICSFIVVVYITINYYVLSSELYVVCFCTSKGCQHFFFFLQYWILPVFFLSLSFESPFLFLLQPLSTSTITMFPKQKLLIILHTILSSASSVTSSLATQTPLMFSFNINMKMCANVHSNVLYYVLFFCSLAF